MVALGTLSVGSARLELAPSLGGAISRLDVGGRPVLRPWNGDVSNPFTLASNILVPFSNRISKAGFHWKGEFHRLQSNFDDDPFPIHGDGFQRSWQIQQGVDQARMTLGDGRIGPWRYEASQEFKLLETGLVILLSMTNTGKHGLPFGCGFHPWFPRSVETRLSFTAREVWMEDHQHLPTTALRLCDAPDWSFERARSLPVEPVNHCFTGWRGKAVITQGAQAVSCTVEASDSLDNAILYSPGRSADFFCLEPVSHPVDAFHLTAYPGLRELLPGQSMQASIRLSWALV